MFLNSDMLPMKSSFILILIISSLWILPINAQDDSLDDVLVTDSSAQFCQGEVEQQIKKLIAEDGENILIKRFHLNNLKLALTLSNDTDLKNKSLEHHIKDYGKQFKDKNAKLFISNIQNLYKKNGIDRDVEEINKQVNDLENHNYYRHSTRLHNGDVSVILLSHALLDKCSDEDTCINADDAAVAWAMQKVYEMGIETYGKGSAKSNLLNTAVQVAHYTGFVDPERSLSGEELKDKVSVSSKEIESLYKDVVKHIQDKNAECFVDEASATCAIKSAEHTFNFEFKKLLNRVGTEGLKQVPEKISVEYLKHKKAELYIPKLNEEEKKIVANGVAVVNDAAQEKENKSIEVKSKKEAKEKGSNVVAGLTLNTTKVGSGTKSNTIANTKTTAHKKGKISKGYSKAEALVRDSLITKGISKIANSIERRMNNTFGENKDKFKDWMESSGLVKFNDEQMMCHGQPFKSDMKDIVGFESNTKAIGKFITMLKTMSPPKGSPLGCNIVTPRDGFNMQLKHLKQLMCCNDQEEWRRTYTIGAYVEGGVNCRGHLLGIPYIASAGIKVSLGAYFKAGAKKKPTCQGDDYCIQPMMILNVGGGVYADVLNGAVGMDGMIKWYPSISAQICLSDPMVPPVKLNLSLGVIYARVSVTAGWGLIYVERQVPVYKFEEGSTSMDWQVF